MAADDVVGRVAGDVLGALAPVDDLALVVGDVDALGDGVDQIGEEAVEGAPPPGRRAAFEVGLRAAGGRRVSWTEVELAVGAERRLERGFLVCLARLVELLGVLHAFVVVVDDRPHAPPQADVGFEVLAA